jgi:maleate isomerase
MGLITLQADETIEYDMRRLMPQQGVGLYVSRIRSAPDVTSETLAQMEQDLPAAAGLLPDPIDFDVVGYGCTSGTSVIGPERIAELVSRNCRTKQVSDPLTALIAACHAIQIKRLAVLSPYIEDVSKTLRRRLLEAHIETPLFGSFEEPLETNVARISHNSVVEAACALWSDQSVDALFLSCTNLQTFEAIPAIEAVINAPVLSSNQVLAWHMQSLSGLLGLHHGPGRLFAR